MDGTLGAGGHAAGILEASIPDGRLLGLDVDLQALHLAQQRLAPFGERACLKRASYTTLPEQLAAMGWDKVDGILLDLGASSMQFDTAERGFSFVNNGPLDMRFDQRDPLTAAQIVNEWEAEELEQVLREYGEEPAARRLSLAIVRARPLRDTAQLAEVIAEATGWHGGHHPATRTFQALRMAVNHEAEAVVKVLPLAIAALVKGGRLAVISFHSLEDRPVKELFRRESRDCLCPPRQPVCTCGHKATVWEVQRRPITPTKEEVDSNPRSRSAKLRVVEKL